jgi:hypothetical protein
MNFDIINLSVCLNEYNLFKRQIINLNVQNLKLIDINIPQIIECYFYSKFLLNFKYLILFFRILFQTFTLFIL